MIGVLGGTFDPVHLGHIHFAKHALAQLPLEEVKFLPCKTPVLKQQAQANSEQRVEMLKLAIQDTPQFTIDRRELDRDTPSYMVETLRSLKQDYPKTTICLLMGMDAFAELPRWHQWQELLKYCHIVIVARPHSPPALPVKLNSLLETTQVTNSDTLQQTPYGKTLLLPIEEQDIASTTIRHDIREGLLPNKLLPTAVLEYIRRHKLYNKGAVG